MQANSRIAYSIHTGEIFENAGLPVDRQEQIRERFRWIEQELSK